MNYRLITPERTMDSVLIDSEDSGKTWEVWSTKVGLRVARLATCATFTGALILAESLMANYASNAFIKIDYSFIGKTFKSFYF